jgi:hypothetical protein
MELSKLPRTVAVLSVGAASLVSMNALEAGAANTGPAKSGVDVVGTGVGFEAVGTPLIAEHAPLSQSQKKKYFSSETVWAEGGKAGNIVEYNSSITPIRNPREAGSTSFSTSTLNTPRDWANFVENGIMPNGKSTAQSKCASIAIRKSEIRVALLNDSDNPALAGVGIKDVKVAVVSPYQWLVRSKWDTSHLNSKTCEIIQPMKGLSRGAAAGDVGAVLTVLVGKDNPATSIDERTVVEENDRGDCGNAFSRESGAAKKGDKLIPIAATPKPDELATTTTSTSTSSTTTSSTTTTIAPKIVVVPEATTTSEAFKVATTTSAVTVGTLAPTTTIKPKGEVPTTLPELCTEFNPCTTSTTRKPDGTTTTVATQLPTSTTEKPVVIVTTTAPTSTLPKGATPTTIKRLCDEFNPCA